MTSKIIPIKLNIHYSCVLRFPFPAAILKNEYVLVSDFNITLKKREEKVANADAN